MALTDFAEEKVEYKLFDLTKRDISEIKINKSHSSHCYITDDKEYFSGFILCDKKDTQTICDVVFFPSSMNGLYIPRLTFYKIRKKTSEVKESKNPEKVIVS